MTPDEIPKKTRCRTWFRSCDTTPRMVKVIFSLAAITFVSFVIGSVIVVMTAGFPPSVEPATTSTTAIPIDGAKAAGVSLSVESGDLEVEGGADPGILLDATIPSRPGRQGPDLVTDTVGDTRIVRLTGPDVHNKTAFPLNSANRWDVRISNGIPLALDLHLGAGQTRLNIGDLNLSSLNVITGAGSTYIDLSEYGGNDFTGKIESHVGDLTIRVPTERNIRITVQHTVGEVKPEGLVNVNGSYVTSGWLPSQPGTELVIEQGVGSVRLEAV